MTQHMDVSEIYGASEQELYAAWQPNSDSLSLAAYLQEQYQELGRQNPEGGWDAESAPDFEALAQEIIKRAEQE